jgi:hypothetical protein
MIKGINLVPVFVTDMQRSPEWYRQVMELRPDNDN